MSLHILWRIRAARAPKRPRGSNRGAGFYRGAGTGTGWPSAAIINEETTKNRPAAGGTAAPLPPQAAEHVAGLAVPGPEGYRLCTWAEDGMPRGWWRARTSGVYYGMGRLLRMLCGCRAKPASGDVRSLHPRARDPRAQLCIAPKPTPRRLDAGNLRPYLRELRCSA
jgi:hypothetical protein